MNEYECCECFHRNRNIISLKAFVPKTLLTKFCICSFRMVVYSLLIIYPIYIAAIETTFVCIVKVVPLDVF
jgi:hypothetical protein